MAIARGIPGRDLILEPLQYVLPEIWLVVVHEYGRGDVHGRDEHHSVIDVCRRTTLLDLVGDIDDLLPLLSVEDEIIRVRLHRLRSVRDGIHRGWRSMPPVSFLTKPLSWPARKRCR